MHRQSLLHAGPYVASAQALHGQQAAAAVTPKLAQVHGGVYAGMLVNKLIASYPATSKQIKVFINDNAELDSFDQL